MSAPERGSFEIDLELLKGVLPLIAANAPLMTEVAEIVLDLLRVKFFLKRAGPDAIDIRDGITHISQGQSTMTVTNNVYQIYTTDAAANPSIMRAVQRAG